MNPITLNELRNQVGTLVGTSRWFELDQSRIDDFGKVTEDEQFIHSDLDRAKETPFGTTIAHGFLTLSMLSAMMYDAVPSIDGTKMGVNYGFEKIRFISPVRSGSKVRAHFTLTDLREPRPNEIKNVWDISIEIQGEKRPALIAQWIGLTYLK